MCYYVSNSLTKKEMKDTFGVEFSGGDFKGSSFVNGFTFPKTPIILDNQPEEAILGDWGLIPFWAKSKDVRKMTLNARIETLEEKKYLQSIGCDELQGYLFSKPVNIEELKKILIRGSVGE